MTKMRTKMKRRNFLGIAAASCVAAGCAFWKKNGPAILSTVAKAIQYAIEVLAIINAAVPPALAAAKASPKLVADYNKAHAAFVLALRSLQELDSAGASASSGAVIKAMNQLEQAYVDMVSALAQVGIQLPGMTAVGTARGNVKAAPTPGAFRRNLEYGS